MTRIAVLCGGYSMEREVSLISGERVYNALVDLGYESKKFDLDNNLIKNLLEYKPDLVYIALHGKTGEDGVVQELLELIGIPYTGPGVVACRLTFDKAMTKEILRSKGFSTPDFYTLDTTCFMDLGAASLLPKVVEMLELPLVVKPSGQGSSIGIKLVRDEKELGRAVVGALGYDNRVVIEKYISGKEIAVSVVDGEVFPLVEIVPPREIFDFQAMYTAGETEYYVPARIGKEDTAMIMELAVKICELFDTLELARVDMIIDKDGTPQILEVNTSPGMTETSLLPMAAEASGIQFEKLTEKAVKSALEKIS